MKIKLSDADRAVISAANTQVPWQGVEEHVLARYELGEVLRLDEVVRRLTGSPIDQLSTERTFTAELTPDAAELLIKIVAGGGQQIKGEHGPKLGALIAHIRKTIPKPKPPAAP